MKQVINLGISKDRGFNKTQVSSVKLIKDWGIEEDAHSGKWERQISILPIEALMLVPVAKLMEIKNWDFTENITIRGFSLQDLKVGSILQIGKSKIKILSIGKENLKDKNRSYIVSREGRFGIVLEGSTINIGDAISIF
jgi:MOSC domain-containing protein YiiM